ncbi:chitinase-3-like protein 1 [Elysia marginata]|uniref:Acidic mammalian chitinase n=1 Tax=Elysia marginata TaxID=1093978 RepID=A0AAV4J4I2_9GAST|nr:chitinase-3-like protein 1 [Elysia marginata]
MVSVLQYQAKARIRLGSPTLINYEDFFSEERSERKGDTTTVASFALLPILLLLQGGGADSNFCQGKSDGLHANPNDCSKYYTCHVGITYEHTCGTLVFNSAPSILSCDFPHNVDCLPGGVRGTNPGHCHGKSDGLHPHPTDCSKYYNCHNGNGVATACPPGTLFNIDRQYCDWENNVACVGGTGRTKTSFCTGKADGLYPNPSDCNKYYQCYNSGTTADNSCSAGLYFDPVLKVCNWPENVQCSTVPTTAPTAAPPTIQTSAQTAAPPTTQTAAPTATSTTVHTAASTATQTAAPTSAPTNAPPAGSPCQRRVCYHTNWSQYRTGAGKFLPSNLDPFLCTHIMYSFANLVNNRLVAFEWNDESTDSQIGNYELVTNLKQQNAELKVLLAVGGWNMASAPFTAMVATPQTRAHFISTSIDFLRGHNFDGLDLDWEYPADRGSPPEDRNRFTALVQELRAAFDAEGILTNRQALLLTAAVAAGKEKIDKGYDIPAISAELDFINLMTYDLHGSWESVTGHNSPLYAGDHESGDKRQFNVDWAASYWVSNGCPPDKLVVGLPLYGRSFTLTTGSTTVNSPASPGLSGPFTKEAGYASYYEVCDMLKQADAQPNFLQDQRVPYLVLGNQWMGYDSPSSLREKVRYTRSKGYGGVMVWAIDLDDFSGSFCNNGPYPLLNAIQDECQL